MARADLLPAPPRTPRLRGRPHHRFDAVTALTVYLVLLLAVPSSLTITALGSVGKPAALWALGCAIWWAAARVQRFLPVRPGARAIRVALAVFVAVVLVSYATALLRGLAPEEVSPADSALLRLIGWAGIALVAMDGIDDPARFRVLLRRVAIGGALMGAFGLLQFVTGQSLLNWISFPGLSSDVSGVAGVDARGGFVRASGTAIHPLEYGTVLCIALPLAVTLALGEHGRSRILRWLPVFVLAAAAVLAVSRSALIGVIAGVLVLVPGWSRRVRLTFFGVAALFGVAVGVAVPGILGTLRGLFLGIGGDSSTTSRVDGFHDALEFLGRFPIVGKGFGTFLPSYHILDDEYLLLAIEVGVVGVAAFLALLVAAAGSAVVARRSFEPGLDRSLADALLASLVAGAVLLAFFDGFSFPMSVGLLFLVIGLCGGALRLARGTGIR